MDDHGCPATAGHSSSSSSSTPVSDLPADLRLRILALLPPHDLALAGRLVCRQAAHRFGSEPQDRTACLSQPLPGHVVTATWCVEGAHVALRQLSLRQKLLLLSTAASSGCEANVEFAWQLLQPHVFPELLQTDHYRKLLMRNVQMGSRELAPNVGPAAVASGLAHLLPSLEQRCPGLLDPGATLEAAARHFDLAGLQAACEVVGQRLLSSSRPDGEQPAPDQMAGGEQQGPADQVARAQGLWRRVMAAAAASATPDAPAKMEWALDQGRRSSSSHIPVPSSEVWGAAAASGDLARVRWLHEHCLGLSECDALQVALRHASLDTIQQMEQQGGYLPAAGDPVWTEGYQQLRFTAAAAARDSAAELFWLAGRQGADAFDVTFLGYTDAAVEAAQHGNLDALQLLTEQFTQDNGDVVTATALEALPQTFVTCLAASSGSVPTLAWLRQEGCALDAGCFLRAAEQGDLPMLRWLLEAGCPRGNKCIAHAVSLWPCVSTPADSRRLVEAVQLLAAAGWPLDEGFKHPLVAATMSGHPWAVVRALMELRQGDAQGVPYTALAQATSAGCEATLEALVGMAVFEGRLRGVTEAETLHLRVQWYLEALRNGDRGTLESLRRLGVPLEWLLVLRYSLQEPLVPVPALVWVRKQQEPHARRLACGAVGVSG